MSKSQCPFPNQFDLLFNATSWTRNGTVTTSHEATAVKTMVGIRCIKLQT